MRRFALSTTRRWHGKLLLWALLCAVVVAGVPRLEVHAHADASPGHQHVQLDPIDDASGPDTGTPSHDDGDAPSIPHAHDASVLSHALADVSPTDVGVPEPDRLIHPTSVQGAATWRTIPPHRPPIA